MRTRHPDYTRMLDKWQRCRDVSQGQDAVHAAGERYLPRLTDQLTPDYAAYVLRATFYNATWRTIAGLTGMMFRKPPKIDVPEALKPLLGDVTMSGVSLHVLAQIIAEEDVTLGRVGVLVDYPVADISGVTQADTALLNLRPTMAMYKAESIINWRRRTIGNQHVLAMVVLTEEYAELVDEFTEACETRYRVLDLDVAGRYRQRLFRVNDKGIDVQIGGDLYPLMNGKPLMYIPFEFNGPDDSTPDVDDPPLIDLVDMNLAHYRVTSDYENACHFAGLPQPWIAGYTKRDNEKLTIGSSNVWVFDNPQAKAEYMELTAAGVPALEHNLEKKEQQMAVLGARMLEGLKKGVESAETASIHRVGEESVLSSIAQTVSIGLTKALGWFAEWAGVSGPATIELNRDFYPVPMSAQMLTALIAAWQANGFAYETLFDNLKQGQIIQPDSTVEDEQTKITNQPPALSPAPPAAPPLKTEPVPAAA